MKALTIKEIKEKGGTNLPSKKKKTIKEIKDKGGTNSYQFENRIRKRKDLFVFLVVVLGPINKCFQDIC